MLTTNIYTIVSPLSLTMLRYTIIFFYLFPLLFPLSAYGECTCDVQTLGDNKNEALKYKLVAIASILVASAIGVSLPILGKLIPIFNPENNIFFGIKAFAAGIILAVGFIHILPNAFENLTSPCLEGRLGDFPFTGLVAMVSAIVTMMIDVFATSYYKRAHLVVHKVNGEELEGVSTQVGGEHGGHVHVHTHATHGHAHGPGFGLNHGSDLLRHRVISQVLELGIVVHSVIIGISLGTSQNPKAIKPLVAALTFHQFFEGMGLGGCISQANLRGKAVTIMAIFFSLTTPIGIAIGFGIESIYTKNSPTSLIVEGIFNSASAGILIYMALVDLLAADFMNPIMQSNLKLLIIANLSLLLGAASMSLLAVWA